VAFLLTIGNVLSLIRVVTADTAKDLILQRVKKTALRIAEAQRTVYLWHSN
jgi:hypothetical protein